jgi:ATP-dependent DNA helicase PIF1
LRLGWAITAHRAQGSTLSRASVSLEKCFTEGQAYVAMSRVKSLDGLNLETARLGVVAAHERFLRFERERTAASA